LKFFRPVSISPDVDNGTSGAAVAGEVKRSGRFFDEAATGRDGVDRRGILKEDDDADEDDNDVTMSAAESSDILTNEALVLSS
jgi:hypothetical protein